MTISWVNISKGSFDIHEVLRRTMTIMMRNRERKNMKKMINTGTTATKMKITIRYTELLNHRI